MNCKIKLPTALSKDFVALCGLTGIPVLISIFLYAHAEEGEGNRKKVRLINHNPAVSVIDAQKSSISALSDDRYIRTGNLPIPSNLVTFQAMCDGGTLAGFITTRADDDEGSQVSDVKVSCSRQCANINLRTRVGQTGTGPCFLTVHSHSISMAKHIHSILRQTGGLRPWPWSVYGNSCFARKNS